MTEQDQSKRKKLSHVLPLALQEIKRNPIKTAIAVGAAVYATARYLYSAVPSTLVPRIVGVCFAAAIFAALIFVCGRAFMKRNLAFLLGMSFFATLINAVVIVSDPTLISKDPQGVQVHFSPVAVFAFLMLCFIISLTTTLTKQLLFIDGIESKKRNESKGGARKRADSVKNPPLDRQ